jgi:hypothetical protein
MVPPAFRCQVALAARAVWIGERVIEVALDGLRVAGGGRAGGGASTDQVLEAPAWRVAILGVRVIALAANDRAERDVQPPDEVGEQLGLRGIGAAWRRATRR